MEAELQGDDKGIVDEGKDGALGEDMSDFARALGDVRLPNSLKSIDTLRVLFADLHDLAKGALPDDLEQIESFDSKGLSARRTEVDLEVKASRSSEGAVPLVRGVVTIENGEDFDPADEHVVAHIVLPLSGCGRP